MNTENKHAPAPTLRRLAMYYHFLKRLWGNHRDVVSCTHIARELRLDPTQVRKDIETTGIVGRSKVGYEVVPLIDSIEKYLGWNNATEAFLTGAGAMGTALLGYEGFRKIGLNIIAAFDSDADKIGKSIHGKEVLPIEKLPDLARRMGILIGIVTVPGEAAQKVVDLMVEGGIRAIWNFAPVCVAVPDHIILENVNLTSSLAILSSKLVQKIKAEENTGEIHNANAHDSQI